MAIKQRPGFEVNVDKTVKSTETKSVFLDIKAGESKNLRFLPVSQEDGSLFFESSQHFNFKQEGQPRAFACINVHGDGTQACPICELVDAAENNEGAIKESTAKTIVDKNKVSLRWHAQVIELPKDDKAVEQLHVVGLSKGTAQKVSAILKMERDNRQPLLVDPDQGQAIHISRNDKSGLATRYEVMPTGLRVSLDSLYPKWVEEFMDLEKAIGLRVLPREELIEIIRETYSNNVVAKVFPNEG